MQNIQQTKVALIIILLGGIFLVSGSLAGILAQPHVINWGFWIALIGGVPLTVFAVLGLLSKRLLSRLAQR